MTGTGRPTPADLAKIAQQADIIAPVHVELVQVLLEAGDRNDAHLALQAAAQLPSRDASLLEPLAYLAFGSGAHSAAHTIYKRIVDLKPTDAIAWYNLASSERAMGRINAAVDACNTALQIDANMASAALLRSEMRKQNRESNHVDQLRLMLSRAPDDRMAIPLHYALGKEFDDLGEYDAAFAQFSKGASKRRSLLDYDVAQDIWKLGRIVETFDRAKLSIVEPLAKPDFGFIMGLPRSGTTLIERVLTGDPSVVSNGETDNLLKALLDGSPSEEKDIFNRIALADAEKVGKSYARRSGHSSSSSIVIEKLPFNSLYGGALRQTLPNARVILMHRVPADNLFAMFSTMFGAGYPFSYAMSDLAHYYIAYRRMINHWLSNITDQMKEISYEEFVENPQQIGPEIAKHMNVIWKPEMLQVEKNANSSATASAAQVRRPIYKSAMGRARNYERHLAPMLSILEGAGIEPFSRK